MTITEFDIIERYFRRSSQQANLVELGIGDDAAVIHCPHNERLAICVDTLVEGVHFPADTTAYDIGHKALAVNLSDLAAMGATPSWATLALTLPKADEAWIASFSEGLFAMADTTGLDLIGGDITHGPLCITIQVAGKISGNTYMTRSGAKPGDLIYVTGTLGDAGAGLACVFDQLHPDEADRAHILERLNRPHPRIETGLKIRQLANSCIDISDGLCGDLNHILNASSVGAVIETEKLPLSDALTRLPKERAQTYALQSGDDYELCFTIPPTAQEQLEIITLEQDPGFTLIGRITQEKGLRILGPDLSEIIPESQSYQHF